MDYSKLSEKELQHLRRLTTATSLSSVLRSLQSIAERDNGCSAVQCGKLAEAVMTLERLHESLLKSKVTEEK